MAADSREMPTLEEQVIGVMQSGYDALAGAGAAERAGISIEHAVALGHLLTGRTLKVETTNEVDRPDLYLHRVSPSLEDMGFALTPPAIMGQYFGAAVRRGAIYVGARSGGLNSRHTAYYEVPIIGSTSRPFRFTVLSSILEPTR